MSNHNADLNKPTFSQAAGIDPLPQPARLKVLPRKARNALWSGLYVWIDKSSHGDIIGRVLGVLGEPWHSILYEYHVSLLNRPGDEFNSKLDTLLPTIKQLVLQGAYNRVFDFLQFVMRHRQVPGGFREFVVTTLQESRCAYSIVDVHGVCTILPSAIPEQQTFIEEAFSVLAGGPFGGARRHLSDASRLINFGDYSGSVRESIHAVESVARRLDNSARKSLIPALNSLSKRGLILHGAFKSGIEKLYGYTSDEDGIRHSLSDVTTNVDVTDAVFMFGACASFVVYLVEKARDVGILIDE